MFIKKEKKQYIYKKGPYKKRPRLCKVCGETEMSKFEEGYASLCYMCHKKRNNNHAINRYTKMSSENKTLYKEKQVKWQNNNFIHNKLLQAKNRAIRHNWDFNLTDSILEDMLKKQNGQCYISKLPLVLISKSPYSLSIDRIDSNKGYTIENTIIVTKFVNNCKNNLSLNDFIKYIKEVCDNLQ